VLAYQGCPEKHDTEWVSNSPNMITSGKLADWRHQQTAGSGWRRCKLQRTVTDKDTSEWSKHLQPCVCTTHRRSEHLL